MALFYSFFVVNGNIHRRTTKPFILTFTSTLYWDSYCQDWSQLKRQNFKTERLFSGFKFSSKEKRQILVLSWRYLHRISFFSNSSRVEHIVPYPRYVLQAKFWWLLRNENFEIFPMLFDEGFPFCHHRFHVWLAWKNSETLQNFSLQVKFGFSEKATKFEKVNHLKFYDAQ